jgi:hypothetical protein
MKKGNDIYDVIFRAGKTLMALLTFFLILQCSIVNAHQSPDQSDTGSRRLTVARVLEKTNDEYVEIVFLESARFYKLPVSNKNYRSFLDLLKDSEKNNFPLQVKFAKPDGDVIEQVQKERKTDTKKKNK